MARENYWFSMDRDGTQVLLDIDLMSKISSKVNIPVIASVSFNCLI